MIYTGKNIDNIEYINDLGDYSAHQSYFIPKLDWSKNGINNFQFMVQREFIQEYPTDYILRGQGHESKKSTRGQTWKEESL